MKTFTSMPVKETEKKLTADVDNLPFKTSINKLFYM